jgi:hypothetical protein
MVSIVPNGDDEEEDKKQMVSRLSLYDKYKYKKVVGLSTAAL